MNSVLAQKHEVDVWNWAWQENSGQLLAYSKNGEVNILLSNLIGWVGDFWRISNSEAIGLINIDYQLSLYLFDDVSATPITVVFDTEQLKFFFNAGNGLCLEAYKYRYLIFATRDNLGKELFRPAMILDLSTMELDLLSDSSVLNFRFTTNVEQLRYIHVDQNGDTNTFVLRERSLKNGDETIIQEFVEISQHIESDVNGDRWLLEERSGDDWLRNRIYHVSDNTDEVIYTRNPDELTTIYEFVGDDLISYQFACSTDCTLELQTKDGTLLTYPLPDSANGLNIHTFFRTSENNLNIGLVQENWLLHVNEQPELLGYRYGAGTHLPSSTSPDKRFSLIADSENYPPPKRMIIDIEHNEIIFTLPQDFENIAYMTFDQEGFIINTLGRGSRILYWYSTGEIVTLPDIETGEYYDILPDGNTLYSQVTGQAETQLYRYNPQTNEAQLLLEEVLTIPIIDLCVHYSISLDGC